MPEIIQINIEHFDLINNNIENNEGKGVALHIKKNNLKLHLLNSWENFVKMYD